MRVTVKALRKLPVDRLIIESVDLSLYIAHAEVNGQRRLIVDERRQTLKTASLMAMKKALRPIDAGELLLRQRSAYGEMVGLDHGAGDNLLELPLGASYESQAPWEH